ncbi:MAG: hypothetical protein KF696_15330 [Planctomycetes bacterium]|nr:hypothetical protein [Planctomycetota bacterium]MCW8136044.1 hypothetical protein [Planctomycetota bacterium]
MGTDVSRMSGQLMIVTAAIIISAVMFSAVAVALGPIGEMDDDLTQMLRYGMLAVTVAIGMQTAAMNMVFARKIASAQGADAKLAAVRTRTIVLMAGGEAAALMAALVILLTGPSVLVAPAFGLFVLVAAIVFPTPSRIQQALNPPKDRYS